MKIRIVNVFIVLFLIIFISCTENHSKAYKTAKNGTRYLVHYLGNDSVKTKESEIVSVNLSYRLGDSLIFNSKSLGKPMRFPIIKPLFRGDLYDGLKLMGTGDSITIEVVADSFYLRTVNLSKLPGYVVPGSRFFYDVKLLKHITNSDFQLEISKRQKNEERKERAVLNQYLSDKKITADSTNTGLYFINIESGRGEYPKLGDMCQVYLSVNQLDGEELFTNFGSRAIDIQYGSDFDTKGFMEGLGMLQPGGAAQLIVPSWIGVGSSGRDMVAPFTTLIYKVKLEAIRSLEEVKKDREQYKVEQEKEKVRLKQEESSIISDYIKKNKIEINPSESGLYLKTLEQGNGEIPKKGSTVTIEYVQYDLVGNIISSSYEDNTPFTYVVGSGAVITGWEEAVLQMRKGEKAWMLIPSNIGWGANSRSKKVKPYSPLVFELELTDIKQ